MVLYVNDGTFPKRKAERKGKEQNNSFNFNFTVRRLAACGGGISIADSWNRSNAEQR